AHTGDLHLPFDVLWVGADPLDRLTDDADQVADLGCVTAQVVRRQHPDGDVWDVELVAPVQQFVDLLGAVAVAVGYLVTVRAGVPPVAVHHDTDMLRQPRVPQVAQQPALIHAIGKVQTHDALMVWHWLVAAVTYFKNFDVVL